MAPGTTIRNIRVPNALWDAAKAKASAEGTDLSFLIRQFLSEYVVRPDPETSIREAIARGLDGEAIAGIDLLIDRFPELANEAEARAVESLPLPWAHDMGIVVATESRPDRPGVIDLIFDDGMRTTETRGAIYAFDWRAGYWTSQRHIADVDQPTAIRNVITAFDELIDNDELDPLTEAITTLRKLAPES